jgi:catechol 2,3-dioxygenase
MTPAETSLPSATAVGRVALRVADLERTTAFYRDVVGLAVRERTEDRATLGADGEALLALRAEPGMPARDRDETGLFHAAFRVPTRTALADALERARSRWRLDGASDHLVSEALYLTDPEDNGVEIYRDRPRDDWPVAEDGRVEMQTLSLDRGELGDLATGAGAVPDDTTVGHVHLEVSSVAASERFYVDGVGMTVRARYGPAASFVAAGDYHHHVGLNTWNDRTAPPSGRGIDWFELVVPSEAALDAAVARLAERGVDATDVSTGGVRVADPDGIELRIRASA